MNGMTILWILVAAALVVIVAALVAGASARAAERRAEKEAERAYEHHHQAVTYATQTHRTHPAAAEVGRHHNRDQNLWPTSDNLRY